MNVLCKPLKCLAFLGGRKQLSEYEAVDAQRVPGRPADELDDDDDDDFFTDNWGPGGDSAPSKGLEAKAQGVERHPSLDSTTKRAAASSQASQPAATPAVAVQQKAATKKETDFFNELGMEPEYKAPRILDPAKAAVPSVSALLDDAEDVREAGGWGEDDLDLKL